MDYRQSNTKARLFASTITFDWLTYLENRKKIHTRRHKDLHPKKMYHSLTMLRPRCCGPMLYLVILRRQ